MEQSHQLRNMLGDACNTFLLTTCARAQRMGAGARAASAHNSKLTVCHVSFHSAIGVGMGALSLIRKAWRASYDLLCLL